jgi:hypothetical protein
MTHSVNAMAKALDRDIRALWHERLVEHSALVQVLGSCTAEKKEKELTDPMSSESAVLRIYYLQRRKRCLAASSLSLWRDPELRPPSYTTSLGGFAVAIFFSIRQARECRLQISGP